MYHDKCCDLSKYFILQDFIATTFWFLYVLCLAEKRCFALHGNICSFHFTINTKRAAKVHWVRAEQTRDHSSWTEWNRVTDALLCEISKHFAFPISHDAENGCVVDKTTACSLCHTLATQQTCRPQWQKETVSIHTSCFVQSHSCNALHVALYDVVFSESN